MSTVWLDVGTLADFSDDRFAYRNDSLHIGIFRVDGEIFAVDNLCTHGNALLTDGEFEDCFIECPLHAGLVDLRTGKAAGTPIIRDTRRYEVRLEDDRILLALPE